MKFKNIPIARVAKLLFHVMEMITLCFVASVSIAWEALPRYTTMWRYTVWAWESKSFWRTATALMIYHHKYSLRTVFCMPPIIFYCPPKAYALIESTVQYQWAALVFCAIVIVCQYRMLQKENGTTRQVSHISSRRLENAQRIDDVFEGARAAHPRRHVL